MRVHGSNFGNAASVMKFREHAWGQRNGVRAGSVYSCPLLVGRHRLPAELQTPTPSSGLATTIAEWKVASKMSEERMKNA